VTAARARRQRVTGAFERVMDEGHYQALGLDSIESPSSRSAEAELVQSSEDSLNHRLPAMDKLAAATCRVSVTHPVERCLVL